MRLTRPTYQRAAAALLGTAAVLSAAPAGRAPAAGGRTLVVRGAGFGHGVGMSQQGALGYARRGYGYRAILAHYYTGTAIGAAPGRPVRVLLQAGGGRLTVSGATLANRSRLRAGAAYTVTLAGGGRGVRLRIDARHTLSARVLRLAAAGPLRLRGRAGGLQGGTYRGTLEVRAGAHGGLDAVNAVALEDYVRGVIANEVSGSWPLAALEAQAVASRTYALTAHSGAATEFDVYPDTRSQVYRGVASEQRATDTAVAATAGQVVTYAGRPVITYFFATSGGRTENVENAFPGSASEPWLRGVPDPFDGGPLHSWGPVRMSFSAAAQRLSGLVRGAFRGIEVTRRGYSPRIMDAYVLGSGGATPVTGDELAARLGLYGTWAYFSVADASGEHPEPDRSGQPSASPAPVSPPGSANGGTPAAP